MGFGLSWRGHKTSNHKQPTLHSFTHKNPCRGAYLFFLCSTNVATKKLMLKEYQVTYVYTGLYLQPVHEGKMLACSHMAQSRTAITCQLNSSDAPVCDLLGLSARLKSYG